METKKRSQFSGKLGFVLAAAGSAVGLGNIWRFPYYAAKYGGGAFILVYIILVLTFGYTLMVTEIAIGRKTGLSPIGAYRKIAPKSTFIGVIAVVVAVIITPYYSVIGGWVIKYLTVFASGGMEAAAGDTFFSDYIASNGEPVLWMDLFILMGAVILFKGVKEGIEKASKVLMPALVLLTIFLAVYTMTLPGAAEGFKYLLIPDFSRFSVMGVVAAMGQMFYSMSLGMAIMITYGSYMKKDEDIEKCVGQIEIFDTGIAVLAAMMIVPAVFVFSGGDPQALNAGPSLMFITLPKVFATMPLGGLVGAVFFVLVLFAALTSIISLMEAIISAVVDHLNLKRHTAVILTAAFCFVVGVAPSLGYGIWANFDIFGLQILDFMDFVSNYLLMPLGTCMTCILVGWITSPQLVADELKASGSFKRQPLYTFMLKYIAPIFTLAIMAAYVLDTFKLIKL
ncbi:MAG: sodium-dependent transporter [Eubacterium sp.]|nr:sodium-dependent transporter [Eubacterium sp.]